MSIINNLKELNEVGILHIGDYIIFQAECINDALHIDSLHYTVVDSNCGAYLDVDERCNNIIFTILNENSREFCKKAYGYTSNGGYFPYTKKDDFIALTRVVRAIYVSLGDTTDKIEVEDEKETDRFFLMDLD